ncbi:MULTISPECIES: tetratricopeptide repeat protein [Marinobacter]|uniref:tetratricopeptide repeat protein n=1 Tax=Marinobacter TaxID=2742 RepID=UPI001244159F|nr:MULTISPECIES: tetratricopeptide repeat protein [Marinobacter]MBL3556375.1 tetratricopeptide repeat protein [Marinobacter sp. JB05H06]
MINPLRYVVALLVLVLVGGIAAAEPEDCAGCHAGEVAQWKQSQHASAMAPARPEQVLGDFSGTTYSDDVLKARFSREDGDYIIQTTENGEPEQWTVRYTFGVYPLQQYLIDIGDGRLQAFNIAWDTRDASAGGQRWFRLDEPGQNHPGDAMHWTGIYQNWNNQCADCHSTGLERNFDPQTDAYKTGWDHIAVSCTACHETATRHAEAAKQDRSYGAGVELAAMGMWQVSEADRPPRHKGTPSSEAQVPTCGRCHSLRTSLTDTGGGQVHDQFSLSRLEQPLYYSDGRVREEVFVLGSFEQSKMFQAGVVCSDCHNPHSGELRAEGNAVCAQCHNAGDFDTPEHHHHPEDSEGAQCVNCHMPESTFMKIDDRREHSFMIPRPDVSKDSGSPDVCLSCHTDRDRNWSVDVVEDWAPGLYKPDTWHHIQQRDLDAVADYLVDDGKPALRRATLLEQRGEALAGSRLAVVERLLNSEHAVVRESGFRVLRHGAADSIRKLAEPGLDDPKLAVRIAAFETLVRLGVKLDSDAWERAREDYEHFLELQSDLPSGRVLNARYLLANDMVYKAEQELGVALEKDRGYVPAAVHLTDILRSGGRNREAVRVIDETLSASPDDARLIHLRGLINLKLKDYPAALENLEQAARLEPGQWLFGYRYAVALYQLGEREKARQTTESLLKRFPDNRRIRALMSHL